MSAEPARRADEAAARAAELAADAAFAEAAAAAAAPPAPAPAPAPARIGTLEAMRRGREAVAEITALPVDAVGLCAPEGEGWRVVVDVVEAAARLGDNDLLATYEIVLDAAGEMQRFDRTGRYKRTEGAR